MAILTKQADGTYTAPATAATIVSNVIDAVKAPFLTANQALDATGARYASLVWGAGGAVAGGMYARKRAESGAKPFLKFLF